MQQIIRFSLISFLLNAHSHVLLYRFLFSFDILFQYAVVTGSHLNLKLAPPLVARNPLPPFALDLILLDRLHFRDVLLQLLLFQFLGLDIAIKVVFLLPELPTQLPYEFHGLDNLAALYQSQLLIGGHLDILDLVIFEKVYEL